MHFTIHWGNGFDDSGNVLLSDPSHTTSLIGVLKTKEAIERVLVAAFGYSYLYNKRTNPTIVQKLLTEIQTDRTILLYFDPQSGHPQIMSKSRVRKVHTVDLESTQTTVKRLSEYAFPNPKAHDYNGVYGDYCVLGARFSKDEKIELINGITVTKIGLLLKAIDFYPGWNYAPRELATCLQPGDSVQLLNGTWETQENLLCRTPRKAPSPPLSILFAD